MGTSTDFSAPPNWNSDLKGKVTRTGGQQPSPEKVREILDEYISSNGGSSGMSSGRGRLGTGATARSIASSLGGFVSSVARVGLDSALRSTGLADLVGRPVTEVLLGLVARFGGADGDVDSVDARNALTTTMCELCQGIESPEELGTLLSNQVNENRLGTLLMNFFANYLYEQFCRVFFGQLITKHGDVKARSYLSAIRDVIRSDVSRQTVGLDLNGIDWAGNQGKSMAQIIMKNTLAIFG